MYLVLLIFTNIIFTFSTFVHIRTFSDITDNVQIYPSKRPYYQYSCLCITNVNLNQASNFSLIFTNITLGNVIYYKIQHPPYIQHHGIINSTTGTYSQIINVNEFNSTGFQTILKFQQTQNETITQYVSHFTITNSTESVKTSLMVMQFDHSYFIIITLAGIFSIFFGRFTKVYRFKTISIKWYFFIIYCIVVAAYIIIIQFTQTFAIYFQMVGIGLLGLICIYYYTEEVTAACGIRYKIGKLYLRDIIALILAGGIIGLWIYIENNWIINDVIALFIVATVIQVIKMSNLKSSIIFFVVILTFNVVMQIVFTITNFSIGYTMINQHPAPLQFQLPTISFFPSKRCTWIQITDIIFPGILINYCRRIDLSLNSQVYSILSYISMVISVGIQMLVYKLVNYRIELPQAIFSIPLLLILLFLFSSRRGQWSIVWYGGFYDKTIQRNTITRSVEWDRISTHIDERMLIN